MEEDFAVDVTVSDLDFTKNPDLKTEYENCIFLNCNFSGLKLTDMIFIECTFDNSNLNLTEFPNTALRDIIFKNSKLTGINFEHCNNLGLAFYFEECNLSNSSFYQKTMKKTTFKNSKLHDVDFTECDLSESVFDNCDLAGATFEHSNLEKADFRTSSGYSIDPEINRIKKARFSIPGVIGLLDKYNIDITI